MRDGLDQKWARFFYCAKDRTGVGLPTVKPLKLMEYLVKLATPSGGDTLDPFMGSGTTCVAACALGYPFIGMEKDADYFNTAV